MTQEAAIQKDVEIEVKTEEKEIERKPNPRDEILANIVEKAKAERDEEFGIEPEKEQKEPEEEEKEEAVPEPEPEEKKEESKESAPDLVKIKVDGEEREVPKDKIIDAGIRAMQKESSADKRLEEATRLLREVQTKYATPQEQPSQNWDDATIDYALVHGNEEQKTYARQLERERLAAIPSMIEAQVMDKIESKNAVEWFAKEYSDIVQDPYLMRLAFESENDAIKKGDTRSYKERFTEYGEALRKWKGGIVQSQTLEEKQAKKSKTVVNLPSASMKKSAPQEQKPKTATDVIEEMRKARGQR